MSTTFGIFNIPVKTDEYGNIISEYTEDNYVKVAYRSRTIAWLTPYDKINHAFRNDIPVYPLDNTAQGIYTIKDIKREIENQLL